MNVRSGHVVLVVEGRNAGTVVALVSFVGPGVRSVGIGDRVLVSPTHAGELVFRVVEPEYDDDPDLPLVGDCIVVRDSELLALVEAA